MLYISVHPHLLEPYNATILAVQDVIIIARRHGGRISSPGWKFVLDTVCITSLIQMTDLVERQIHHIIYLLPTARETCCSRTCWEMGVGSVVWPLAPSISSPRTSRAVGWKHRQDQPQGSHRDVLLDIEFQLDQMWGGRGEAQQKCQRCN